MGLTVSGHLRLLNLCGRNPIPGIRQRYWKTVSRTSMLLLGTCPEVGMAVNRRLTKGKGEQ